MKQTRWPQGQLNQTEVTFARWNPTLVRATSTWLESSIIRLQVLQFNFFFNFNSTFQFFFYKKKHCRIETANISPTEEVEEMTTDFQILMNVRPFVVVDSHLRGQIQLVRLKLNKIVTKKQIRAVVHGGHFLEVQLWDTFTIQNRKGAKFSCTLVVVEMVTTTEQCQNVCKCVPRAISVRCYFKTGHQ